MIIRIGDRQYDVEIVDTYDGLVKGLGGLERMDGDKGMLFVFADQEPRKVFNTMEMRFPIDIVFINQDREVVDVARNCRPGLSSVVSETGNMGPRDWIDYVLEVNVGSGIVMGDILEMADDDDPPVMKVLAADGTTQMELWGGERIVSRRETQILVNKARKAAQYMDGAMRDEAKADRYLKQLGKYAFKVLKGQDTRPAEYVGVPK